jgi:hypothetical protein
MKTDLKEDAPGTAERVREIPKWAGRYAHNRTLPVLLNLGLFLLAAAVILGSSTLASREGQAGHKAAAGTLLVVSLAASAAWVWLVMTRRFGRLSRALSARLYGAEGTAVAAAKSCGRSRVNRGVALAFGLCIILQILAGFAFETTIRYMVPIMAAYLVPFLLYLWARQGGMTAPFMLLWPGLMLIHAALALAGVPPFSDVPNALTVLIPTFGYGAIAALASHAYSRFALRRVRSLAQSSEAGKEEGGQHA